MTPSHVRPRRDKVFGNGNTVMSYLTEKPRGNESQTARDLWRSLPIGRGWPGSWREIGIRNPMCAPFRWVLISSLLCGIAVSVSASEFVGRVVGVLDGDTVDILTTAKEQVRVRLAGIDAPEKRQAFGNAAKRALSDLVYSREVQVDWHKKDRYGRVVGKVLVGSVDADLRMLELGMAWHYKQYEREQSSGDRMRYAEAENVARSKRAGLWRDANPVPPWAFRRPATKAIED